MPDSREARACLEGYYRELAERFETGFDPAANPSRDEDMRAPRGYFVLACLEGKAIGCGVLVCERQAALGEIKRVWIDPSARGWGIAKRLLRHIETIAREQGLNLLRLDTNRVLLEAQAFYRQEGYREIERFNDNPYAHHWFAKCLARASTA